MTTAYHKVSKLARDKHIYMRDAAYLISVDRVVQAAKARGWI
jgi:glutamate dehydrogenase/leucine dehydrogenase